MGEVQLQVERLTARTFQGLHGLAEDEDDLAVGSTWREGTGASGTHGVETATVEVHEAALWCVGVGGGARVGARVFTRTCARARVCVCVCVCVCARWRVRMGDHGW